MGEPLPRRVVVFRALQLGDVLCAVPALRALRVALPGARITLIGLPWARGFAARYNHYLDAFIEFPGYPGLPEKTPDVAAFRPFLDQAQSNQFDLALQLHGSGSYVNSIVGLLGASSSAGFFVPGDWCPDERRYAVWPQRGTEVERLLALTDFLGVPRQGGHIDFPLTRLDDAALWAIPEARSLQPEMFVCIHPGARWRSRRWLPERFAAVGDELAAQGLQVVLTGSADEIALTHRVRQAMKAPVINLAGRTTLGALAALLTRARLLICNDTGISHVAAALRVPSVVITLGSDPDRWSPDDHALHRPVLAPVDCRPCAYRDCPIGQPCATNIEPRDVIAVAQQMLERRVAALQEAN